MRCCRPSCGVAMLVAGGAMASGDVGRVLVGQLERSSSMWMWIAILAVVMVSVSSGLFPVSAETGEPS
ncbi:MAG: hypothetical protein ACKV2T_35720 [Kofleriaceae bacterium]